MRRLPSLVTLKELPLSSLVTLKELRVERNWLSKPPISILRHLTALATIDMGPRFSSDMSTAGFSVPSSLLPILHPGLTFLDLRPSTGVGSGRFEWDDLSLRHIGHAARVLTERGPLPRLLF